MSFPEHSLNHTHQRSSEQGTGIWQGQSPAITLMSVSISNQVQAQELNLDKLISNLSLQSTCGLYYLLKLFFSESTVVFCMLWYNPALVVV